MTQGTPKKRPKFDDWRPLFIDALREYGVITYAATAAGVSRTEVYRAKKRNAAFSDEWDDALEQATDELEKEARRRAEEGVTRLKFWQGMPIMVPLLDEDGRPVKDPETGHTIRVPYAEREYSDTLMIFLLKAHRPEKFRDNVDITSKGEKLGIAYVNDWRGTAEDD